MHVYAALCIVKNANVIKKPSYICDRGIIIHIDYIYLVLQGRVREYAALCLWAKELKTQKGKVLLNMFA